MHEVETRSALSLGLLAQRPGCRVPRVCEDPFAGRSLLSVQFAEGLHREEDFTAHFHQRRIPRTSQARRDPGDVGDVFGHILADHPIPARRRAHESSVLVPKVYGESVDLQLAEVIDPASGVALDLRRPRGELVEAEHVIEAEHALGVPHRVKEAGYATTNGLGRAVLTLEFGERSLQFIEPPQQEVVLGVADKLLVALVVRVAQVQDAHRQRINFRFRDAQRGVGMLLNGWVNPIDLDYFFTPGHHLSLGITPDCGPGSPVRPRQFTVRGGWISWSPPARVAP